MKAKTELLLYRLLWLAEKPLRPSYYNLEQSFEGWAYHNGLLLLLLADSKGPKVDAKMVEGAWDFEAINSAYLKLQETLERFPQVARDKSRESLAEWTAKENATSRAILRIDPLLPSELLPKKYVGKKTWKNRCKILAEAARLAA